MIDIVKKYKWGIVAAVAVVVLLVIPLKINFNITMPGKIVAASEWIVNRGLDGRVMTTLINNRAGGIKENFNIAQFDRGDAFNFNLVPNLESGTVVLKDDTIANIYSSEINEELVRLNGEIEIAKASLRISSSNEKESIIDEEKKKLDFARRQLVEETKLFARQKKLFEKELISEEEYEVAAGSVELSKINVEIAEERLKSVSSGSKKEMVDFYKTQIKALENDISVLKERKKKFSFISPISGIVSNIAFADTILIVSENSSFVVVIPIEWNSKGYVETGCNVEIDVSGLENDLIGTIIKVDRNLQRISNKQIVYAFAEITSGVEELTAGLFVNCKINCDEVTPREYISRYFAMMMN